MAFKLLKDAQTTVFEKLRVASQAYTIGDVVMLDTTSDSIDVVPATSTVTPTRLYGVAMETVTSSATSLLVAVINPTQLWEATADNAVNANHNFLHMLLADANSVNNTTNNTTDEAVFLQKGLGTTSTKIVGSFSNFNVASI